EGDWLSLDGTTGRVIKGKLATLPPKADDPELLQLMGWAEPFRKLRVRANADIPRDAIQARAFGAEGIGLCRTEHMFFEKDRIPHMQAMILTDNEKDRRAEEMHEFNPMLGHRGCRLGITYPEITEMQVRAIFEAAVAVAKDGVKVFPEVMIPLTATLKEMANQAAIVNRIAQEVFTEKEQKVDYLVG